MGKQQEFQKNTILFCVFPEFIAGILTLFNQTYFIFCVIACFVSLILFINPYNVRISFLTKVALVAGMIRAFFAP
jgi:hypothetical protein